MHQTQNFLFSFFLLFLLTTFEFVISERPVKMSDQPKVCLDLNGHLGSSRHCPLTGHYFEPWFICLSLLLDLFYFSSESIGKTLQVLYTSVMCHLTVTVIW